MSTKWASVPGYDRYEVSTLGEFRRSDTKRKIAVTVSPHNGYGYVRLSNAGLARNYRAHRLVLLAFGVQPNASHQVRHLDGIKTNNRLANLAWGTASENARDKARHGTAAGAHRGERHHNAKLTARKVQIILSMRSSGHLQREIAAAVGTTQSNVSRVLSGETWQAADANSRNERRMSR